MKCNWLAEGKRRKHSRFEPRFSSHSRRLYCAFVTNSEMVSMIPRRSSFAVSGTPTKAHVQDLIGPLRFLRVEPALLAQDKAWQGLLRPRFYPAFAELFNRYAILTHKAHAEGLDIPRQTRYCIYRSCWA